MGSRDGSFSSGLVLSRGPGGSSSKLCTCRGHLCPVGGEIKLEAGCPGRLPEVLCGKATSVASAYSGHLSSLSKRPTQLSREKGRDAVTIQKQPQAGT